MLTPGRPVWSLSALDELHQRFVLQPDTSHLSFEQKLAGQLTGAPDDAVQLMAEVMLMHLLINRRISGNKKRDVVHSVLGNGSGTAELVLPEDIQEALDYGIAWPGTFFNTGRDRQIRFLIEWMRNWASTSHEECVRLLADPW